GFNVRGTRGFGPQRRLGTDCERRGGERRHDE
ncbi:MAG: hypothetical protein AVDCRST_MAG93-4709, partial [uncultured Chloroflexia bacterium]